MLSNTNNPIALRSVSVNVTTNDVQFVFRNYVRTGRPYFGGLYVDLAQAIPTGTLRTYRTNASAAKTFQDEMNKRIK